MKNIVRRKSNGTCCFCFMCDEPKKALNKLRGKMNRRKDA